jgi:hypothetical protein
MENMINERTNLIEKLKETSKSEEKFDSEYVISVQKLEGPEAQKTIRQYQICVAAIKIAAKIAFVLNIQNILNYLSTIGIKLGGM